MICFYGLPGGTRTPDLLLRRQLLYPVELRAVRLARAVNAAVGRHLMECLSRRDNGPNNGPLSLV